MATKSKATRSRTKGSRKSARAKASVASTVSTMAAAQLKHLRKTVEQLQVRLKKEASARTSGLISLRDAKKARDALAKQVGALKQQSENLSKELRKALTDSDRRESARQQALAKIAELRGELTRRTDELRRKSEELAKLARESAGRARDIIMSEAPAEEAQAPQPSSEQPPPAPSEEPPAQEPGDELKNPAC